MHNAERHSVLLITSELSFTPRTNKLGKLFSAGEIRVQ